MVECRWRRAAKLKIIGGIEDVKWRVIKEV